MSIAKVDTQFRAFGVPAHKYHVQISSQNETSLNYTLYTVKQGVLYDQLKQFQEMMAFTNMLQNKNGMVPGDDFEVFGATYQSRISINSGYFRMYGESEVVEFTEDVDFSDQMLLPPHYETMTMEEMENSGLGRNQPGR